MAEKVMRRAAAGQSFSRGSSVGHPWVVRGSSIIRFAAMFLMLMTLSVGQVWADGGFWDDNAATITFVKNGSNDAITLKRSATGVATKAYGNVESLSLKEVSTNVWKSNGGNITGTSFFYKIYRSGDSGSGSFIEVTTSWSKDDGSNQVWKKENINKDLLSGLTPGNYILKYYLQAKGSSLSDGQQYISNGSSNYTISFTVPVPTYYIKHNWGGAGNWTWQGPMDDNGDGTYSYVGQYGGTGCNWNTKNNDTGAQWIASPALVGSPQNGDECTFTLNPSARTITITKIPTCIAGAPTVTINNPGNGYVGQTVTLSCSIATGDVTYKAYNGSNNQELASSVVSIAGNQATFNAVQDPVYIVATVTNSAYCTETNTSRSNSFAIQQLQYHLHKNYDSDEIDFQNVNYNTATAIKACPFARDGYTFAGWATSADGDVVYADGANGPALTTGNQALFAKWTENSAPTYTITLKDYNNSVINGTVTATLGSNVLAGAVVHEDRGAGLTFRGYYTGQWAGGTKVIDNAGKLIANAESYTDASGNWIHEGDVILIAGWTGNNYTITFDNQEATTAGTANLSVKYSANTNLTEAITVPAKTGYTFGGYYTAPLGGGLQVFDENGAVLQNVGGYITNGKWMKAANVTLYAKWTADAPCVLTTYYLKHTTHELIATFEATANANEYDLTFKLNNDIINGLYVEDNCGNSYGCSTAIQPGQSITLTTAQSSFNFQGAAQNNTWHYTFNSATKTLSCDAQSEEQKAVTTYLIQFFNYNGGDPLQSGQVEEGQNPSYTGATPTHESDAEWDYSFKGWEPALYAANKDQNYSATYNQTRREYTLTWNLDGGNITTPGTDAGSVANASTLTAPVVEKTGYTFAAWSPVVPATMPAANATYTATWTPITYNITYNLNGGTGATNRTYTIETETIVLPTPTKDGFSFVGWFDNSEFTGSAITQITSGSTGNKTFYAKWNAEVCVYVLKSLASGFEVPGVAFADHTTHQYQLWAWDKTGDSKFMTSMSKYPGPNPTGTHTDAMGNVWYKFVKNNADCADDYAAHLTYNGVQIFNSESSSSMVDGSEATKWAFAANTSAWIVPGTTTVANSAKGYTTNPVRAIVTYTITINNGDHGTVAPNGDQEVGSAGLDLTVTPESGYIFNGWNTTGGASMDGNHLTATADGTVTATYREAGSTKIYFYNDKDWATVKVHKYNGSLPNTVWPGVDADLETLTHDGHKVYSVTITEGEYANVIFNNNNSGKQTSGIEVSAYTDAKPATRYLGPDQQWEWIALPTQNYKIVYGSKLSVTNSYASGSYVDAGTELTFTAAAPETGYTFAGFFSDGGKTQEITGAGVDIENRTYTVTLNSNIEVHAKYTEIVYTISLTDATAASVSAGQTTPVSITAADRSGYTFVGWTAEPAGNVVFTNASAATTTILATGAATVTANFCANIAWDGVQDNYYVYIGQDLNLPTEGTGETYAWSGSDKITDNVYNCPTPHKSQPTVTATSTCNGSITANKQVNVYAYKHFIKYPMNGGTWYTYSLTRLNENTYYRQGEYGGSMINIISHTQNLGDGYAYDDMNSLNSYRYYTTAGNQSPGHESDEVNKSYKESEFNTGDPIYIIYNNASATNPFKTAQGHVDFKAVESISFSYTPTYTMTGYAQDPAQATAAAAHLTGATVTKQVSTDGGETWSAWESFTPSEAGTYKFRATATGTNALGVESTIYSDVVEVVITKPSIDNIAVSAYPRAGQTVTVTPTVTGLQSGTYHYCWSIVDQTIDFTDNGNGTFSFTAPVAGNYTLHMDVKPGDDCEAEAIISKDETLTILGDYIVINMKRDPETLWELDNNIYYYKGDKKNEAWPGEAMTFLGKDEDDYPWYTYTIEGYSAYDGGWLIFNDAKGSGEGSMHQTADIAMPQTDACYYVKANLDNEWKRRYELIDDCPDLTRRVLLLSGTENKYQNVTYTIKAKAIFLPGEEITYTYAVTDPDGDAVTLDAQHAFYPTKAGDYTISITARNENSEEAHSEYIVPMIANPVTLKVQSGSIALNSSITLRARRETNFPANSKFTFTVIEPGTHSQVMFSEVTKTGEGKYKDSEPAYTLRSTGKYIFNVVIRNEGGQIIGAAELTETIAPMKAWVKHNWDGSENNWVWQEMTYRNDGTYAYYNADAENGSYFRSTTANVTLNSGDREPSQYDAGATTTLNPDGVAESTIAVYVYDVAANTLTVRPADAGLTVYRIKSVCSDGTYYSNTINTAGQQVSFYAQKNGSLVWQHRASTAIDAAWEDGDIISASIPEDNVYTATATTLGSALSAPSVYLGGYTIYSPVVGGRATMTSFTPNPDAANEYFNNYYVLHADNGQAVATVGNEINHNLSTVLPYYELPQPTNLRYAYNNNTNVFVRNYLADAVGTEGDAPRFLQLYGLASNLKKADGTTIIDKNSPVKLIDQSNWVYTYDAKGVLGADDKIMATIRATYNGMQSWILSASGLENDEDANIELLTSKISGAGTYTLRLVFDYKTNRLTAGWVPSGTMNEGGNENTVTQVRDILVQRIDDGETTQFSIEAGTVVAVDKMTTEFIINKTKWDSWNGSTVDGKKTMFFWLSLPYECKLADIYGFGTGNVDWDIQRYRGDLRDKGTAGSTPWRDLHISGKMNACEGYVLAIRLKEADFKEIKIDDVTTSQIRLFFPSNGKVELAPTVEATLKPYVNNSNTIQRDWHAMGVPVMTSGRKLTIVAGEEEDPFEFAYKWTWADGGRWYEPIKLKEGDNYFNFLSGHAYMVQGHGSLTWNYEAAGTGSALNAPRRAMALTGKDIRVNLVQDNTIQDKTYVLYRHTGSRDYEIGRDLEKIENSGRSMIYSELDSRLASICLSDTDNVQIPLTVVANADGEYTLAMPYNVSDVEPVLYDAVLNTTTMLNYVDYTVQLQAGTYKNRFFLSMKETQGVVTDLGSEENQSRVVKFVDNDGRLMILRDGHLYDAQGHMVR